MKGFWISEVVLLLYVVELQVAPSVSQFSCPQRNLTAAVDDIMRLYIDGVEITGLPNADIWNKPDVVGLPCDTRLIAIRGRNRFAYGEAGILASTDDGYVLTNSSWICSNVSYDGWEGIDFDDSDWTSAVEISWVSLPGVSPHAEWIWLREWNGKEMDAEVFCRRRLDINECLLGAPDNECDPSMGKCIDVYRGYNCRCYEGYTNNGAKRCIKGAASAGNNSTAIIILAVFLGVSVLANIVLLSAVVVLNLRKKTAKDEGQSGEDRPNPRRENDNAVFDETITEDFSYV